MMFISNYIQSAKCPAPADLCAPHQELYRPGTYIHIQIFLHTSLAHHDDLQRGECLQKAIMVTEIAGKRKRASSELTVSSEHDRFHPPACALCDSHCPPPVADTRGGNTMQHVESVIITLCILQYSWQAKNVS
mmetsp:Transcript_97829/g.143203  ORF Transcript_97829/g.143203 Transcript_97829/m.143203 type:complete len:133 (+) Transcript_97829:1570-1968(+)